MSLLYLSATQVETFLRCKRQWLMQWPWQMPQVPKGSTTVGTVLHAVVERWLSADDLGRGPDGKPVNIYPEGWMSCEQKFGAAKGSIETIDAGQAAVIQKLVAEAIESGVLVRVPGRKIEHRFTAPLIPGAAMFTGSIDMLAGATVIDHKTSKSMRYAKSANDLRKSPQMMAYAKIALDEIEARGEPEPAGIWLQHNVYCLDPNDLRVRKTLTDPPVPVAVVRQHWESLKPIAEEMIELKARFPSSDEWSSTPEPAKMTNACNAFGGCAFLEICGGRSTPPAYSARVRSVLDRTREQRQSPATIEPERKPMPVPSLALRVAAKRAAAAGGEQVPPAQAPVVTPAPAQAPVVTPAPAQAPVVTPAPASVATAEASLHAAAAPWAWLGCTACKKDGGVRTGWNTKLNPCMICVTQSRKQGRLDVLPETLDGEQDGTVDGLREMYREAIGAEPPRTEVRDAPAEPPAPAAPPAPTVVAVVNLPQVGQQQEPPAQDLEDDPAAQAAVVAAAAPIESPAMPAVGDPAPAPRPRGRPRSKPVPVHDPNAGALAHEPSPDSMPGPGQMEVVDLKPGPESAAVTAALEFDAPRRGRPPAGYTLFLGCHPIRGYPRDSVVDLDRIFARLTDTIVKEYAAKKDAEVSSYWQIDAFKRRDAMATLAEELARQLGTSYVYSTGTGPDYSAFLDVIMRRAARVVQSVGSR